MEQHHHDLATEGIQSIAIAMGKPEHARRYCGKLAPSVDCLSRTDTHAYMNYGLQQGGAKEFMSFDVLKAGFRAFSQGHTIGKPEGDVRMLPGNFLVDTAGIVRFVHYSDHAGDHPAWSRIFAAITTLT